MALEMRTACERCGASVEAAEEAYICSYECTYCPACAGVLDRVCPNCSGRLERRPTREAVRPGGDAPLR